MKHYLAIDLGASGGRLVLGHLEDGKLVCEMVYRFPNQLVSRNNQLIWDMDMLFAEILKGLRLCNGIATPVSVGINTWGVDFVLLDENGAMLGEAVSYRDNRTTWMDEEVAEKISETKLYRRTGIQKQIFNTVYQLMAVKKDRRKYLSQAKTMLMIPDYLHYRLCGVMKTEYTNATTTGLINAKSKKWDDKIIRACGFPRKMFTDIVPPGTPLGELTGEIQAKVGFNCRVVAPATHDTGSAVMAIPSGDELPFISSGTWSLMGVERNFADCGEESRKHNFTNEGGYGNRFRYLKNIMGLWMIQSVRKELGDIYSFDELCKMAEKESITSVVDCSSQRFLAPESMIYELQLACDKNRLKIPTGPGELAAVVYNSLAASYRDTVVELEKLTGVTYPAIHIIGGGANADYLNRLTAKASGKTIYAGPAEATAIGNLLAQMIADGEFTGLEAAKECVKKSFTPKIIGG